MIRHLEEGTAQCFQAVRECRELVEEAGLEVPSWTELSVSPPRVEEEPEPNLPRQGWQQKATKQLEIQFMSDVVWPGLNDSRRAMLRSPRCRHQEQRESPPSLFGSFSAADCTFLSPCLTAPADVAANLTNLATIAQRAQRQGCWGRERSLSSAPQRKSAGRQALGSPLTCSSATWTWQLSTRWMGAGLRSLRTGSHCGVVPSWPSTRRWCLP